MRGTACVRVLGIAVRSGPEQMLKSFRRMRYTGAKSFASSLEIPREIEDPLAIAISHPLAALAFAGLEEGDLAFIRRLDELVPAARPHEWEAARDLLLDQALAFCLSDPIVRMQGRTEE